MASLKPTAAQVKYLTDLELPVPATKKAAGAMLAFVIKGAYIARGKGWNRQHRLEMARAYTSDWQDVEVSIVDSTCASKTGVVSHLIPTTQEDETVHLVLRDIGEHSTTRLNPFKAVVVLNPSGKRVVLPLSKLNKTREKT